jgi:hypothetical protein
MSEGWAFNRDYHDNEQARPFMPAFLARFAELRRDGKYKAAS